MPVSGPLVLSYWNLNGFAFGGARRIEALLRLLGPRTLLCQPAPAHPQYETVPFRPDLGRRKLGINWGIFNFMLPGAARAARRAVAGQPPLIVATSIWAFIPVRRETAIPVVLDAHDVSALALAERFGAGHPFTRQVRRWEGRVVRSARHVFVCSAGDREQMISMYGVAPDRITAVPNGVDLPAFAVPATDLPPAIERELQGKTVLFFMGKLDYQPNRAALRFMNDQLLPALEQARPGRFKLLVCGGPRPAGAWHPAMLLTGRVPEVLPYVQRADLCLAPLFTGSGTRLKILEYLAAAKPVVATPKAAEGLVAQDNRDLALAPAPEFAARVLALAGDPAAGRALGLAGRELVRQHYDWNAIREQWKTVLGPWLAASAPDPAAG